MSHHHKHRGLAADWSHPRVLYAGTDGRGLLKSADGGATWYGAGPEISNVNFLTIDQRSSSTLLVGGNWNPVLLFRSTNGGESWAQINFPRLWDTFWGPSVVIDPLNSDDVYLLDSEPDSGGYLYKSTDGGKTWYSSFLHDVGYIWHLVADPTQSGTLYAYGADTPLKSTDGAQRWKPFKVPIETMVGDPVDTRILYAVATRIVYRSADGGDTWSTFGEGLAEEAQALAVSASNPPMVFTGTRAGTVYKNASMLTLNRREYCVGDSWKASIVNAPGDAAMRLVGVSNGVPWDWPGWGTTENDGHFTASGTFGDGSQGSHSLYVQIGGINSNVVSLSISDCK